MRHKPFGEVAVQSLSDRLGIPDTDFLPLTNIPPSTMPLETTVDILDDATHDRLDKKVIASIGEGGPTPGIFGAWHLFLCIAVNSEGCIDLKSTEHTAMALLEQHPDLQTEVWQAWEAKSFKHIRNLSISDASVKM